MIYTSCMKVIFGIGNPEKRYAETRHNIGFMVLNTLASQLGVSFKRCEKFHADIAQATIDGEKILLVKPTTYYNLVGQSARAILDFYKLTSVDFLVIHDDLNLPIGTLRTRIGGSDGGNNGIKSLNAHLGVKTARLRVGTWTDQQRSTDKANFVLDTLNSEERSTIEDLQAQIREIIDHFVDGSFQATTYK